MSQDEVDQAVAKAVKAVQAFEDQPSLSTAKDAEWVLSIFKLLVGCQAFDSLPAFSRALKAV